MEDQDRIERIELGEELEYSQTDKTQATRVQVDQEQPGQPQAGQVLPGQERFVAPVDEDSLQEVDAVDTHAPSSSLLADTWRSLRRNPLFFISTALILFIVVVALFPRLFTHTDPIYCELGNSLQPARAGHPFGFDLQGCDIYARVIYGTRTSVSIGVLATLLVVLIGGVIGALAGFFGGWVDALLSRVTDVFFAIPLLLGAIVVLQMFKNNGSIWKIILVMAIFGWVSVARIARGAVMEAKNLEFNTAATALGSSPDEEPGPSHHSERFGPGDRRGNHVFGNLHRSGSHLELPRSRPAHQHGQLGSGYRHGPTAPVHVQRDRPRLPLGRFGHHGARLHHDGGRGQGRLGPQEQDGMTSTNQGKTIGIRQMIQTLHAHEAHEAFQAK